MSDFVYKWINGSRPHVDAETAGRELQRILQENGVGLTPEVVVDESRSPTAPLHDCFEWNDHEAAEEHRRNQARYLLRSLVVVTQDNEEVRAFINVRVAVTDEEPKEQLYVRTNFAMRDSDLRQQVLQTAFQQLESWARRYNAYAELAPIRTVIARVHLELFAEKQLEATATAN